MLKKIGGGGVWLTHHCNCYWHVFSFGASLLVRPHMALPLDPTGVLSLKAIPGYILVVRSLKHLLYGKCCTAVTTSLQPTITSSRPYIESAERQLPIEQTRSNFETTDESLQYIRVVGPMRQ